MNAHCNLIGFIGGAWVESTATLPVINASDGSVASQTAGAMIPRFPD